jgi:hypothetical protein
LSKYWFLILFLVAGGIFAMVSAYYSAPYDVREAEAGILADKVLDCISYTGRLTPIVLNDSGSFNEKFKTNFLDECHFNFGSTNDSEYSVLVKFFFVEDLTKPSFEISSGNINLFTVCNINDENYDKLAKCVTKRIYSVNGEKEYLVEVLSVVRKVNENAKI